MSDVTAANIFVTLLFFHLLFYTSLLLLTLFICLFFCVWGEGVMWPQCKTSSGTSHEPWIWHFWTNLGMWNSSLFQWLYQKCLYNEIERSLLTEITFSRLISACRGCAFLLQGIPCVTRNAPSCYAENLSLHLVVHGQRTSVCPCAVYSWISQTIRYLMCRLYLWVSLVPGVVLLLQNQPLSWWEGLLKAFVSLHPLLWTIDSKRVQNGEMWFVFLSVCLISLLLSVE